MTPNTHSDEIRIAEAATPGPWTANLHHTQVTAGRTYGFIHAGAAVPIAAVTLGVEGCSQAEGRANAAFIAHFNPERVLAMLAEKTAMLSEIETLKGERDKARRHAEDRLEAVIEADRFNGENYIRAEAAEARATRAEEALKDVRVFVQDCLDTGHDRGSIGNLMSARDVIDAALQPQPQEPK
jgi:hypothetical protein